MHLDAFIWRGLDLYDRYQYIAEIYRNYVSWTSVSWFFFVVVVELSIVKGVFYRDSIHFLLHFKAQTVPVSVNVQSLTQSWVCVGA